jgi:ATP-binding cassette subfamily B protein
MTALKGDTTGDRAGATNDVSSSPNGRPAPAPADPGADAADAAVVLGTDPPSRFEPVAIEEVTTPPPATIDPDRSKMFLRRLAPLLLARKGLLFSSIVAAIIGMGVNIAVPAAIRAAVDNALIDQTDSVTTWAIVLGVLALARGAMVAIYRRNLLNLGHHIDADLRSLLYNHLTRLSFSFYDRTQAGQVISRANSDVRSVAMLLQFGPIVMISVLSFCAAFVYMLTIHVPLALVTIAPLPLVYVVGRKMRQVMFPLSWINQARLADISTVVDENINGVRVVKSFAAEERQVNELAGHAQQLRWSAVRTVRERANYAPIMENLPRVGIALVLLYGGRLAIDGEVTIGTLVAFNAYVILLQAPFRMLGFFLMTAERAKASAERIFEVLDERPEIVDRPGATELLEVQGAVAFTNVHFGYGSGDDDAAVLAGFSLDVPAGQSVAIVGRTGCGKSTVARLLARFYEADSGSVTLDGHDVGDLTLTSLRHHVGMVLDEPFLFSTSVHDNIAFARPDASRDDVIAAAKAAQAHDFITNLDNGYDTEVGERGYTLSGGQRQRIAIARTLLANPAVLVLDDATSAIDVAVEAKIHDALHSLTSTRTTIVIAHRLSTISLADRVIFMDNGQVVADGTHTELLATEPRYVETLAHNEEQEV